MAVELAGGPHIKMKYGRRDADLPATDGNLPDATPPEPARHVREVRAA